MTEKKVYPCPKLLKSRFTVISGCFILVLIFLFILPLKTYGQEEYDEIPVFLNIPQIGGGEIDALIRGTEVYLPVTDLFDFLKIRNIPDQNLETITGFFINPDAPYVISRTGKQIIYQGSTYTLEEGDLIRTESNLYLKSKWFGKVFGLDCTFSFRSLSVTLTSKLELPLIREMKQEAIRKNMIRLRGNIVADTTVGRNYSGFEFGMADWSVNAFEEINGRSGAMVNLALGAMIAGGQAEAGLYYNSSDKFSEKQQRYLWRYVNNDFSPMRQINVGKINTNTIASLYSPVIGVQVTNTPTTFRRSFGTYILSDRTEPEWLVELYVNGVLVNYMKADASGFFTFRVPLVYGNSMIRLKFYGPWGEERTREQNITIPFNFLPVRTMEYTASAGIVEDTLFSRFSRLNINYGATRRLTIGGGVEYLSKVTSGPVMPFVNASLRVTNNLLVSGDYTYGVRARGTLSYRMPSNIQLDLNYSWYSKDQKAIFYNYREERKAVLSVPLRFGNFSSFQRFSLYQIVLPSSQYTTADWLFSSTLFGVNTNLTTYAMLIADSKPYFYSNLSLAMRLPAGIIFRPQVQYGYNEYGFISARLALEKRLMTHAYLNFSYEQLFISKAKMAEVGFRYDFKFAQTGLSVRQSDKRTSFVQYARGSLIKHRTTRYFGADNRTNVGRGGIAVTAYLDINQNKVRDAGESKVPGLNLKANGGRIVKNEKDSSILILGLEPYVNYLIELDPNSFERISWRLPVRTLSVVVDPNIIKNIEIPISVVGEATGNVTLDDRGEKRGLGRIIIRFRDNEDQPAGKTLTESDGYFSFFGLAPGNYSVSVDSVQLQNLRMTSDPESLNFEIEADVDGDVEEGLDFILTPIPGDTTGLTKALPVKPAIRKDTTYMIVHEVSQELITITEDSYAIQLGAFKRRANAEGMRNKLIKVMENEVEIVVEGGFFKVRILGLKDRTEVDDNLLILRLNGITEVWVISLKAKQQQWVLTEKRDSILEIKETVIEQPLPISSMVMTVQAGAFRTESNAIAVQERVRNTIDKPVEIINEGGFYKVRISGFANKEEMEKLLPSLGIIGLRDIWILPVKEKPLPVPVIRQPEIKPVVIEKPVILPVDTLEKKVEEKPAAPEPTVSLRVGVFQRKVEAVRAQRRISNKLGLNVEIVQQWGYYQVIVTGFYTRQETYKYYPELAGLGYPNIVLIEK